MQAEDGSKIEISRVGDADPLAFAVTIRGATGATFHHVTLARAAVRRLAQGHTPEQCIEAAFQFLLDREPKEQILARFDVSMIAHYFPEFERELPHYLRQL